MKLFYEDGLVKTYEMADALLKAYGTLPQSEWLDHFSDVIGSFAEIFTIEGWDIHLESYNDLVSLKSKMGKFLLNGGEVFLLRLVNTTIRYEKNTETIRQVPENYLLAWRDSKHSRWICDPDLAADLDTVLAVFQTVFTFGGRYCPGETFVNEVRKRLCTLQKPLKE